LFYLGDLEMAKEKKDRGALVTIDVIKGKCKDCGKEYEANKMIYENEEVITPQRCVPCQTAHLTNLRVNKTIKDFTLLGNLKNRLSDIQREAILESLSQQFKVLVDRYSGTAVKASAFDLKKIKA